MKSSRWEFPLRVQLVHRQWAHPAPRLLHSMAHHATPSRCWCKIKKQKDATRRKRKGKIRKVSGACREKTTKLGLTSTPVTIPCSQHLKHWEMPQAKSVGAAVEHRGVRPRWTIEGKFRHQVNAKHCVSFEEAERLNCTWTGKGSGSFFGFLKAVKGCDN